MMTNRGPTVEAIPNVLQDETVPNTLAGLRPAASVARRRPATGLVVVSGAAIAAIVALIVVRLIG